MMYKPDEEELVQAVTEAESTPVTDINDPEMPVEPLPEESEEPVAEEIE